jgi:integrase
VAQKNRDRRFTPKTIVYYYLIAAAVFATAKDRKGKQLFPRQWDLSLPAVDKKAQNAPTVEAAEIETILSAAKDPYRVLYALLAGSGLRIAEALGLEIGKHLSADCSIVFVRQQRSKKGERNRAVPKNRCGLSGRRSESSLGDAAESVHRQSQDRLPFRNAQWFAHVPA